MSPSLTRWTAATLAAALFAPATFADEPPTPDPVGALRDALRRPADDAARAGVVARCADLLRSPGEAGRALLLKEWRDEDAKDPAAKADLQVRETLLTRFEEGVRKALAADDATTRHAAATLVCNLAVQANSCGDAFDAAAVCGRGLVRERLSELGPDLLKLVADDDAAVRAAAVRGLGKIHAEPGKTLDGTAQLLGAAEKDDRVRAAAAEAIDDLLTSAAADWKQSCRSAADREAADAELVRVAGLGLSAALGGVRDEDVRVRRHCAHGIRKASEAAAGLAATIPGVTEREGINDARERLKKEREAMRPVLDPLNKYLGDIEKSLRDDPEVQASAWEVLRAAAAVRRCLRPTRLAAEGDDLHFLESTDVVLPALFKDRYHLVHDALADPEERTRQAALSVLEEWGSEASGSAWRVTKLLKNRDAGVRLAAARALGVLASRPTPKAVPALAEALEDSTDEVRQAAAAALVRYGPAAADAVKSLAAAVKRADGPRLAALQALAAIGEEAAEATPEAMAALEDSDAAVRAAAAAALGRFGRLGDFARAALRKALDDPDPAVRLAAAEALLPGK